MATMGQNPKWASRWRWRRAGDPYRPGERFDWMRYGYDAEGHPGFRHLLLYKGTLNARQEFRRLVDEDQMRGLIG